MNAPLSHIQLRTPWQALLDGVAGNSAAFHAAWMDCLVQGLGGAVTEAVLVLTDEHAGSNLPSQLRPVAFWPAGNPCGAGLAALCEQALAMRMVMSRNAVSGVASGESMLAMPLMANEKPSGVIGLVFRGAQVPQQAQDWLRWGIGWLQQGVGSNDDGAALRERLLVALDLTMAVLGETEAPAAANAFVTEAAVRLGCDRVSLGYGKDRSIRLAALSNSADFSRKLDLAQSIEAAMNEACDQGSSLAVRDGRLLESYEPLPIPATGISNPVLAVTSAHEALTRGNGTRVALSVPFYVDARRYGVVCFEWADADVDDAYLQVALGLPPVIGQLLLDKRHAQRAWPVRLLDAAVNQLGRLIGPRYALQKLLLLVLVGSGVWLFGATGTHRVSAKAALEGGVRRVVAAPFDGYVATAQARAGEIVKAGQTLATLDDRDMRLEVERWQSQQTQYARQMQDAQAQRNLAQVQIAMAQARQAAAQRRLSESMLSRTKVYAPFAGVVVSGDLSQSLGGAVKKGQILFEIAPLDSYRIILEVDEADVSYLDAGQTGELMVTALPGQTFPFTVKLVTPVAHTNEGHNLFRVEATLNTVADRLRPGMEGIGKVSIGERNQVWIWTHRMTDWLRLQLWNWFGV